MASDAWMKDYELKKDDFMLYPKLTESRTLIDLDGMWDFKTDDGHISVGEKWKDPIRMTVPASYNDLTESVELRDYVGVVYYQRGFHVPKNLRTERIVLRFAAVTHKAIVYLNGKEITRHKGGFLPFEVEITDFIQSGENLLTVAVDNIIDKSTLPVGDEDGNGMLALFGTGNTKSGKKKNNPNFDFFNYAGIIRPVKIYTTPKNYIEDIALVSKIHGRDAGIQYKVRTVGAGEVRIEVYDQEQKKVAEAIGPEGEFTIKNAHLWKPLGAYLYDVVVKFGEDTYTERYGVRTAEVRDGKFFINSEPFYFKGYGKHEDTFPNGRGFHPAMNQKDISLMKWQNANSFRTSHYPYSEEMMNLCDEEGIVVINEVPAVGIHLNFGGGANFKAGEKVGTFAPMEKGGIRTFAHHKEVLRDVIARDKNHACVVMWSIANESDSSAEGAYEYFKPLYDLVRELDPQKRPRTIVSVQMENYKEDVTAKLSDVICLNRYYGWYFSGGDLEEAKEAMAEEFRYWDSLGKPFMLTEYGADTVMGLHDTAPTMWTEEYQVQYYKMNHEVVDACRNFCGEQVWNFADFATSQGLMRVQGNKKGLFTRDRKPKLAAYYFKDRWGKTDK